MTQTSNTDILQSFEELKKTAFSTECIATWYKQNAAIIDPIRCDTIDDIQVYLGYRVADGEITRSQILDIFYEDDPDFSLKLDLCVIRTKTHPAHLSFFEEINAIPREQAAVNDNWEIPVIASEWSFIVGMIASRYMQKGYWRYDTSDILKDIESFLDQHLPNHFPGTSTKSLRSLYESDLLPDYDTETLMHTLYSMKNIGNNQVSLPSTYGCE